MTSHAVSPDRPRLRAGSTVHAPRAGAVPVLHHFTCSHFEASVRAVGAVVPHRHPLFPTLGPVAWFTTDTWADPDRTGLTGMYLECDRTRYRFRVVEPEGLLPWLEVVALMKATRQPGFTPDVLRDFHRFGAAESWWVSPTAVPVVAS